MTEEASSPITDALARIAESRDLTREETRSVLGQVMRGEATGAQIGAFLMGLRMKGETAEELTGAAEVMRELATPVRSARAPLLDTCGTGGDGQGTVNISTAVAFVAAGAGAAVAKHGNRSVSSRSGSADVLEALGIRVDLTAEEMGACLDEVGLAFLFAPTLHAATRHAVGPRREMKLRTLFNLLGPLTNPAGADRQLLGVYDPEKAKLVAEVLGNLGSRHAWVVHSDDGLDEISIAAETRVHEVRAGGAGVRFQRVAPEAAGLSRARLNAVRGGTPEENARWLEAILSGARQDASRDMVVLNAAAALHVCGIAGDLEEGRARAEESIDGGGAAAVLAELRRFTAGRRRPDAS